MPPLTGTTAPVTWAAAGEASQTTAAATCSGDPRRGSAWVATASATTDPGVSPRRSGVVIQPGITALVAGAAVPIAYGEHMFGAVAFADALAAGWPDIVQPDPAIAGGLSECLRVASLAEGYGTPVVPHSSAGPFALASALHLAACRQNVPMVEHSFTLEPLWEALVGDALSRTRLVDGCLPVPDGPGWGLAVDEDRLRATPYRPTAYDTSLSYRSIGVL